MKENEAYDFSKLVLRYLKKELNREEESAFLEALSQDIEKSKIFASYMDNTQLTRDLDFYKRIDTEAAWDSMMSKREMPADRVDNAIAMRSGTHRKWLPYAAIFLCILGFVLWNILPSPDERLIDNNEFGYKNDVRAMPNTAVLQLSGGKEIILGQSNGIINDGAAELAFSENGELNYKGASKHKGGQFNELKVANAGKFRVNLSDGSVVWVSSLSTLRYPVAFDGAERRVSLEGEAYFDIAKDVKRPFYVEVGGKSIRVLGTQFNVSAYGPRIRTTLVEGSVRIEDGKSVSILKPGQQAVFHSNGVVVQAANVKKDVAWKEGYFSFERDSIKSIVSQIASWYEVTVIYEGDVKNEVFSGSVPRASSLGGVLQALTDVSGLRFEIDGRNVTVKINN